MAKIRKIYDETIKPNGEKTVIYPITSTRAVYTPTSVTIDSLLNEGYRFGGIVLPTDSPSITDQRVFYGASVPGNYVNFGGINVDGGEAIFFMWDGTTWHKGIFGGAGSNNLTGFKSLASITDLPNEPTMYGYLINDYMYVWVGENGDTLSGTYQNVGQLRGASAYEVAVRNGYEGTEQQWLSDPVNGIKGVSVTSVTEVGTHSDANSAENTYRITLSNNEKFDMKVKNGKGINSVTVVGNYSHLEGAVNTYRITLSDNTVFDFQVINGSQGNTGSSIDYPFELLNVLNSTATDKGVTALKVKELNESAAHIGTTLNQIDTDIKHITDFGGTPINPVTHERGVLDSKGANLEDKLKRPVAEWHLTGAGNTFAKLEWNDVLPGKRYRFRIKSWPADEVTQTGSYAQFAVYSNNTDTENTLARVNVQLPLSTVYDVTTPDDCAKLILGGRINSGEEGIVEVEDITYVDELNGNTMAYRTELMTPEIEEGKMFGTNGVIRTESTVNLYKYEVIAEAQYSFSCKMSKTQAYIYIIAWYDEEENYIKREKYSSDTTKAATFSDIPLVAPTGAAYCYMNVARLHTDKVEFNRLTSIIKGQRTADGMEYLNGALGILDFTQQSVVPVIADGYVSSDDGTVQESSAYKYAELSVAGASHVRFLGYKSSSSGGASGYAFYDAGDNVVASSAWDIDSLSGEKEYIVAVPEGAKVFRTTLNIYSSAAEDYYVIPEDFYIYRSYGMTISDRLASLSLERGKPLVEWTLLGKGDTIISSDVEDIIPGHNYRVYVKAWPNDEVTQRGSGYVQFAIYSNAFVTANRLVETMGTDPILPYYDVVAPSDCEVLIVGGRINAGAKGIVAVQDITAVEESKEYTDATDKEMKREVGVLQYEELPAELSAFESGYVSKTDGSIQESANYKYTTITITYEKRIRFLGNAYKTPSGWSNGYAFYDANDDCIEVHSFDSATENHPQEYTVEVPENAAYFRTSVYVGTGSYNVVREDDFYAFGQYGHSVSDAAKHMALNSGAYTKRVITPIARMGWRYTLLNNGKYGTSNTFRHARIDVSFGDIIHVKNSWDTGNRVVFLEDVGQTYSTSGGNDYQIVEGSSVINLRVGEERYIDVPRGAVCAAINMGQESAGWQYTPDLFEIYTPNVSPEEEEDGVVELHGYPASWGLATSNVTYDNAGSYSKMFRLVGGCKYILTCNLASYNGVTIRSGYVATLPYHNCPATNVDIQTVHAPLYMRRFSPATDTYLLVCGLVSFTAKVERINDDKYGVFDGGMSDTAKINTALDNSLEWEAVSMSELTVKKNSISGSTYVYMGSVNDYRHVMIPVDDVDYVKITANSSNAARMAWTTEDDDGTVAYTVPSYVEGTAHFSGSGAGKTDIMPVPAGASYLYIAYGLRTTTPYKPVYIATAKVTAKEDPRIFEWNPNDVYEPLMIAASSKHYNQHLDEMDEPYPTTLLWLSDIHADSIAASRFIQWKNRYAKYIDDAICTGDQVRVHFYENFDWWAENGLSNVLQVIGNHDSWAKESQFNQEMYPDLTFEEMVYGSLGTEWPIIKQKYVYDKYLLPFVDSWDVVQPDNAEEKGYCFFYKDYDAIRLIVLDCMHYHRGDYLDGETNVQDVWFRSVLADAKTNSKAVVVATHFCPAYLIPFIAVPCIYNTSPYTGEMTSSDVTRDAYLAVNDFMDAGGEFVCWLQGHTHRDRIYTIQTGTVHEQFVVLLTTGSVRNPSSTAIRKSSGLREADTKTDDAFNLISFDTSHRKLIKVVRIGANINDNMEQYHSLVYRYADGTDDWGNPLQKGLVSCN